MVQQAKPRSAAPALHMGTGSSPGIALPIQLPANNVEAAEDDSRGGDPAPAWAPDFRKTQHWPLPPFCEVSQPMKADLSFLLLTLPFKP